MSRIRVDDLHKNWMNDPKGMVSNRCANRT